jgi:hypothetical protein
MVEENRFMKMCESSGSRITEINSLKELIYINGEQIKVLIEQLKCLNDSYIRVFKKVFSEPQWLTQVDIKFHFQMYFLLHAYVGDELVFFKTGRMVRLNFPSSVPKSLHCAEKMDWFNTDYNCPGKISLCVRSVEGYDFFLSKFLKPFNTVAKTVPKVYSFVVLKHIFLLIECLLCQVTVSKDVKDRKTGLVTGTKLIKIANPAVSAKLDKLNALHEDDARWNEFSMHVASYESILQSCAKSCQTALEYKFCQFSSVMEAQELNVNHKPSGLKFYMNRVETDSLMVGKLLITLKDALVSGEMPDPSPNQILKGFKTQYTIADEHQKEVSDKEYADRVKYVENVAAATEEKRKSVKTSGTKHVISSGTKHGPSGIKASSSVSVSSIVTTSTLTTPYQSSNSPVATKIAGTISCPSDVVSNVPHIDAVSIVEHTVVVSPLNNDDDEEMEFDGNSTPEFQAGHRHIAAAEDDCQNNAFLVDDNASVSSHEVDANCDDVTPSQETKSSLPDKETKSTKRPRGEDDVSKSSDESSDLEESSDGDSDGGSETKESIKESRRERRKAAKYPLYSNNMYGNFKSSLTEKG